MKPRLAIAITLAAAVFTGSLVQGQASRAAEEQFKAAQNKEEVEGDLQGAIEQYKKLAQGSDRAIAAKALVRMAASYEKLGQPDARSVYERVVRDFAEQTDSAATARARLAAIQTAPLAGQTTRLIWRDRRLSTSETHQISADGRYLTFSYSGLTLIDLKEAKTKTFSPAMLGSGKNEIGWVEGSAISPDGRQVAYVLARVPQPRSPATWEIRVLQVSGGDAGKSRRVPLNADFEGNLYLHGWSPDGKEVNVTRFESQKNLSLFVSIADGVARVLDGRLSPDGRFVADSRQDGGNENLFVKTMDGKETRIDVGPGRNWNPLWSHDGSHILFFSNRTGTRSLWMAPVAGGTPSGPARLVKERVGDMYALGFTRSGALYYLSGSRNMNVYVAELDAKLRVAAAPSMATDRYINSNSSGVWSPDGENLAYLADTVPAGEAGPVVIRVRSVKTGEDRQVPARIPPSGLVGPVRWFPDGQSLLVASRDVRVLNGDVGYYRVNIVSGDAELLHQTAYQRVSTRPDLSPDGKTIFYLETPGQPVRFDIDSRRETRLTAVGDAAVRGQPPITLAVSPDGAQVAYLGKYSVVVASATGGEPRAVARFSGYWTAQERDDGLGLAWSPDGRYLFFVRPESDTGDGSKTVWRVPLAGGQAENVGLSMDRIRALRMHPDGRRLAFDSVVDPLSEVWALENFLPKPARSK